jgi:hypothetical protein
MAIYLRIFLAIQLAGIAAVLAVNLLVDPFGIYRILGQPSVDERTLERDSNGARIAVSHAVLRGGYRAIIVGNSRVQLGFPTDVPEIPGGLLNAGVPAANAREVVRVLSLARHVPGVDCAFVSLDFESFESVERGKAGYAESALADGSRLRSWIDVALAYRTLEASFRRLGRDVFGTNHGDARPTPNSPAHRERFIRAARSTFNFHRSFVYDPQRLALLAKVVDLMTRDGIQVIGFFTPVHAWNEELNWDAGQSAEYLRFRRDAVRALSQFSNRQSRAPCSGTHAVALWDFAGYRGLGLAPSPGPNGTAVSALYREATHFRPAIGRAALMRMLGRPNALAIADEDLGQPIGEADAERIEQELLARRAHWLATPDAITFKALAADWRLHDPLPQTLARTPLTAADFEGL